MWHSSTNSGVETAGAWSSVPSVPAANTGPSPAKTPPLRSNDSLRTGPAPNKTAPKRPSYGTGFVETPSHKKPLRRHDLVMVLTQLSIMSRSGVDIADSVRSLSVRSKREDVKEALSQVHAQLESGQSLSQAFANQGRTFGGALVAIVKAGEASGRMSDVLTRLSVLLRDELRLLATLRSVLSYPALLLAVTSGVIAAMVLFVLPQFAEVYQTMRAPTPPLTQMLLNVGTGLRAYWWAVLCAAGGFAAALGMFWRSTFGKSLIDHFVLRSFLLGNIFRSLLAGRAFRLIGTMLESGVPLLEALELARNATRNTVLQSLFRQVDEDVMDGKGIAAAFIGATCIPEGAGEMIATAEATGQLSSVFLSVGEFYEAEGEQLLRDGVKILEPIIIVGLGVVVASVVLSIMLPLLDLSRVHRS